MRAPYSIIKRMVLLLVLGLQLPSPTGSVSMQLRLHTETASAIRMQEIRVKHMTVVFILMQTYLSALVHERR